MTPILSVSHKQVQKLVPTHAVLAMHRSTQRKRIFPIAKLPRGWKYLKLIPINVSGKTRSEVITELNRRLDKQVNSDKPPIVITIPNNELNVSPPVGVETVNEEKSYWPIKQLDMQLWTHNNMLGKHVKLEMRDIEQYFHRIDTDANGFIIYGIRQNRAF